MTRYPADISIPASIDRFRRAFKLAGIAERDVKVTWDMTERWCRLRCRLADGRAIERVLYGSDDDTWKGTTEALMCALSVWTWNAAKRVKAGQEFIDETCATIEGGLR